MVLFEVVADAASLAERAVAELHARPVPACDTEGAVRPTGPSSARGAVASGGPTARRDGGRLDAAGAPDVAARALRVLRI